MTLKEAYIYMYATLEAYWERTHDEEVGDLVTDFDLWFYKDEKPLDPASWQEWIEAVHEITNNESIDKIETLKAIDALLATHEKLGFKLKDARSYIEDKLNRINRFRKNTEKKPV